MIEKKPPEILEAERKEIFELLLERYSKATPRGRDVRKLPKPYKGREVVFTCSNGWTIEKVHPDDFPIEGFFMGHCMGGDRCPPRSVTALSLREPDGTPHVTLSTSVGFNWGSIDRIRWNLSGRGNKYPKASYVELINESGLKHSTYSAWGDDDDNEYHELGILTDEDYRDNERRGVIYRDADWHRKRGIRASQ